jgi:hypothetical protein
MEQVVVVGPLLKQEHNVIAQEKKHRMLMEALVSVLHQEQLMETTVLVQQIQQIS